MTATTTEKQSPTLTIQCQFCQTWNRIDAARAADRPKCGKCARPILLDRPLKLTDDTFDRTSIGTLLKKGVKIWEYQKTLLHQKVIVVDGVWSSVGSTNFDDRSFDLNDEVNIGVMDPAIAAQLRAAFENDLRHAKQRQLAEWKDRGAWHKFIDGLAYLGRSQL